MTTPEQNIATVREIYAAFGRQDAPAILERLHPDVAWEFHSEDHGIPWLTPGRGREHALRFLQTLAGMELRGFTVHAVMGDGPWVVGLVAVEFVNPATGRSVREPMEAHVWQLEGGRVVGMRHAADTYAHRLAAGLG